MSSVKDTLRTAYVQSMIDEMGDSAVMEVYSSAPTGKTAGAYNADPSGLLVSLPFDATPFGTPSGGQADLGGTIEASATGGANTPPLSYRIKTVDGGGVSTVVIEGAVDVQSGSPTAGKLSLKTNVTAGQLIRVATFTLTAGDA